MTPRQILWLTVVALSTTVLLAIAFVPPLVGDEFRALIMAGYRQVCHQLPSRSFHFHGEQVALCHRCVGIWGAIPIAVGLFAVLRRWDDRVAAKPGLTIVLSLVPLGIDWTGDILGVWTNTTASRLITGAIFGLVAGYFLARVVVKSIRSKGPATNRSD